MTHPYIPTITLEDILNYRVEDETTYTKSPLINAVAEALCKTKAIQSTDIAHYLELDPRMLASAVMIETGMKLIDLIHDYRMHQILVYIKNHPKENLDTVAQANGYASAGSLWRFFQRRIGTTPLGKKSEAGEELWQLWLDSHKKK